MLLALGFGGLCIALTSMTILVSAQCMAWWIGRSVFETHRGLAIPAKTCSWLVPPITVAALLCLVVIRDVSAFETSVLAVVGAIWIGLMRSRAGFVFVLLHVCLAGRFNRAAVPVAPLDDVRRSANLSS